MSETLVRTGKLVTVFGGSGFVGRYVVKALAEHGWRVRVASRRPDLAFALQPSGKVGQITAVQANLRYSDSVARAVRDADAVVNLVGLLSQSRPQTFDAIHTEGTRAIVLATKAAGIERYVQMSAIGADAASPSVYGRTKAAAETIVFGELPDATIVRPSVVFGPEDAFFNRFAAMAQLFPALPLIGGGHGLLQPVFAGDVAAAVALAVNGKAKGGTIYELGGPERRSFKDIMRFILEVTERDRPLVPIPFGTASLMAGATEIAKMLTLGLLPKMLDMTRDQVELLKQDNVVSDLAKSEGRTLEGLGITPESFQSFVPGYLYSYRKTGQYAGYTAA